MKREFLFRAEKLTGKGFVEGYLVNGMPDGFGIATKGYEIFEVDTKTVAPYINRTDKTGKKVYEGDIVRYSFVDEDNTTVNDDFLIEYVNDDELCGWRCKPLSKSKSLFDMFTVEDFKEHITVIGNKWTTPELLRA